MSSLALNGNNFVDAISHELFLGSRLYLGGTIVGSLDLDEELYRFLQYPGAPAYLLDDADLASTIHAMRLLNRMFLERHDYAWQDACFFQLKDVEWEARARAYTNWGSRLLARAVKLVGAYGLGWGVRLSENPGKPMPWA